ncbi:MAG: hypothetical protein AB1941_23715 [Gemmatimonadota bacterium]
MMDRYEGRANDRSADARTTPAEGAYARRIDCCDSPRSRERSGGGRGRGSLETESYSARSRRSELD